MFLGGYAFDCSLSGGYAFDSSLLGGCAFGGWAFGRLRFHEAYGSNEEKSALVDSTYVGSTIFFGRLICRWDNLQTMDVTDFADSSYFMCPCAMR